MILEYGDPRWPTTLKGTGENGYYFYEYSRNGCHVRITRAHHGAYEQKSYFNDWMPDRAFPSLQAMEKAALDVTEAQAAAAVASYPMLREIAVLDGSDAENVCHCCKPGHRKVGTVQISLARTWVLSHDYVVSLCEDHEYLMADPNELLVAVEADMKARRA